jgi:hypothetical protein
MQDATSLTGLVPVWTGTLRSMPQAAALSHRARSIFLHASMPIESGAHAEDAAMNILVTPRSAITIARPANATFRGEWEERRRIRPPLALWSSDGQVNLAGNLGMIAVVATLVWYIRRHDLCDGLVCWLGHAPEAADGLGCETDGADW